MGRRDRGARRTEAEIAVMRRAGRVVAEMHEVCREAIRPGVTTADLDALARDVLAKRGATSNFLGYGGFPAVLCASVNDEIVHGIPGSRVLEEGDVVSIRLRATAEICPIGSVTAASATQPPCTTPMSTESRSPRWSS